MRKALDDGKDLGMPDGVLINGKGPYQYNKTLVPDGIDYETITVHPGECTTTSFLGSNSLCFGVFKSVIPLWQPQERLIDFECRMWESPRVWTLGSKATTWFLLNPKDPTQFNKTTPAWTFMLDSLTPSWLLWTKTQALITTSSPVLGLLMKPYGEESLELESCTIPTLKERQKVTCPLDHKTNSTKHSPWIKQDPSGLL